MELDQITEKIIGCAYDVSNSLGSGFIEKVYGNALYHRAVKQGLRAVQQYQMKVMYDGVLVGEFFADLLIEELVLVELKAVRELEDIHVAQAMNYLKASGLPVCLLINFGRPKIEIRHLVPYDVWKNQSRQQAKYFHPRPK
jgi:GxxExxY protein